ncbi:F204A protein, partial [Centropus bengalensis]|nr:F204A protein [Centropus bengalensis]
MWSGLLPPGLRESDVDLSSDEGDGSRGSLPKEEGEDDVEGVQLAEFPQRGPESDATCEPISPSVTGGESDSQTCPAGVPLNIWNKFVELQKKNHDMRTQANEGNRSRKRKRRRKGLVHCGKGTGCINDIFWFSFSGEQLVDEEKWKELTQYFGANDRFESPADIRAAQKSGLELSMEKAVAEGDIDKAEELSDRLAMRELGVKIAKAVACRNFVKAKQEAEAAQEAGKKKKLAWG